MCKFSAHCSPCCHSSLSQKVSHCPFKFTSSSYCCHSSVSIRFRTVLYLYTNMSFLRVHSAITKRLLTLHIHLQVLAATVGHYVNKISCCPSAPTSHCCHSSVSIRILTVLLYLQILSTTGLYFLLIMRLQRKINWVIR